MKKKKINDKGYTILSRFSVTMTWFKTAKTMQNLQNQQLQFQNYCHHSLSSLNKNQCKDRRNLGTHTFQSFSIVSHFNLHSSNYRFDYIAVDTLTEPPWATTWSLRAGKGVTESGSLRTQGGDPTRVGLKLKEEWEMNTRGGHVLRREIIFRLLFLYYTVLK